MRDKIEEVGIHFSKRRSNRDKYRFMNRLVSCLKEAGCRMDMMEAGDKHSQSHHLVTGDLNKSRRVFLAAYDTGSKMLVPGYRYTPLDSRRNFREEMKNIAAYSLLTLIIAVLAVYLTRMFWGGSMAVRALIVMIDIIAVLLVFRWMKKPDNKVNMNRNSGAVAVLYSSAEKSKDGCFLFVDNGVVSNQGFYEVSERLKSQDAVVLDSVAGDGDLFLACKEQNKKKAEEITKAFACRIRVWPLSEEEYKNTPLEGFQNGYILTAGEEKNGKIYVRHARTSADMDLNVKRMEQIRDGILKLV